MAIGEVKNGGAAAKVAAEVVTFTAVKPQLVVEAPKAADAVQFYKSAFGAEVGRTVHSKRKADQELPLIVSAQLKLAGSTILVSDSTDSSAEAARTVVTGFMLCLETDDVEAAVKKAVSAGGVAVGEISEDGACCGGRVGKVQDPYGYVWLICSPEKEKLGEAEA